MLPRLPPDISRRVGLVRTRSQAADETLVRTPTTDDLAQPAERMTAQPFAKPVVRDCPKKVLWGKRWCGRLAGVLAKRTALALAGDQLYRPAARSRRSAAGAPSAHRRGQPMKGRPAARERARPAPVAIPSKANSSHRSQPDQQPVRGQPLAEKPAWRSACEVINGQNQRANESFARDPAGFSRPHVPDPIAVS